METAPPGGPPPRPFPYATYFGEIPVLADLLRDGDRRAWLTNADPEPPPKRVVLYLGCNVLRTTHLAETVVDVLNHLGEDFVALGGPANCCGLIHDQQGDAETASKLSSSTIGKFEAFRPGRIVAWCPSCTHHLGVLEERGAVLPAPVEHITEYLAERLRTVEVPVSLRTRVALHAHVASRQQERDAEAARKILAALPGVEVVEVRALAELGRQCTASLIETLSRARFDELVNAFLRDAQAKGVDTVVTLYHSCQRELCDREREFPVRIENYITLVARGLGLREHEDKYKRFKLLADPDRITAELAPTMAARGITREKALSVIRSHFGPGP